MSVVKTTDVLIVGGGGAACRAALSAYDSGVKTMMVLKGKLGSSGTTAYKVAEIAGFNVPDGVADLEDNPEEHLEDILEAGLGMADEKLARVLTEGAEGAKNTLENWGMNFEHKEDGQYLSITGCFSKRPRMHIIKGHGEPIIQTLVKEIKKRDIDIIQSVMLTDLLIEDGHCVGAVGINEETGNDVIIRAKATIMATGGAGQLFKHNLNPADITGDGHAMGYRAGAEMVNMEFMQAGLGFVYPVKNIFNAWLWMAYPVLKNNKGEEFLSKYLPEGLKPHDAMDDKTHYPFSCRDNSGFIEIAIQKELRKGLGTDNDGVYIDFTAVDEDKISNLEDGNTLKDMWPLTRDFLLKNGVDIREEAAEITTYGHALNGGIKINEKAESTIPGLFAAGEVAGGPHGADRLGGNMMITCQIYGKIAGKNAANYARENDISPLSQMQIEDKLSNIIKRSDGEVSPGELKQKLAETMWNNMLIVRSAKSIGNAARDIAELQEVCNNNLLVARPQDIKEVMEFKNLLAVAQMIIETSKRREESRGSHYREDFPAIDEKYNHVFVIRQGDGTVNIQGGILND